MNDRQLSAHFKLSELTHSDTADQHGIDNSPTPEHLHNLETYTAPGLENVREICGGLPVNVHVAYRNLLWEPATIASRSWESTSERGQKGLVLKQDGLPRLLEVWNSAGASAESR